MSRSSAVSRFSRLEHPIVLAAYTLIALALSFPLAAQFGDHIAGVDGDVWSYLWAMGWARASLLDLGVNPFHTDYIFYPLGGATQLLWGTALPSFASLPLQLAFGLVPAFNAMYLAASVLTAYGMYLLGKEVLTNDNGPRTEPLFVRRSSFVVGLIFAFSALRLGYGLAFTNLFHTEFIPFYVLFLLRATRNVGWKNAILAGFFFALNVYIDFQIAAFLAILTALWFLYVLIPLGARALKNYSQVHDALRVREDTTAPYARWLIILAVAGILSLPMLGLILNDFTIEGGNYIRVYPLKYSADRSYDALSFVLPNARSTLYQNIAPRVEGVNASVQTEGESELSPDRQSFLGITVVALALLGAIRFRRKLLFWILLTLVFALLSLGPVLHIAGANTNIPLPFAFVNNIPVLNHIRIPMRYGLMVFFGASVLAGAGTLVLLAWRRWLFIPLVALVLLEAAVFPYPTLEFRVPPVYEQIAQTRGDFSVLEIPSFNWRHAAKNEAYQAIHQKRILRAYTNRIAPDLADYFNLRQTPIVVRSLRILEGAEKGILTEQEIAQDRAALDDTLQFFNLRYALVHRDQLDAARVAEIDAYLRNVLNATMFYQDDSVTGYQLAAPSHNVNVSNLDLANNANLMYLGRGWQTEPLADQAEEQGRYLKGTTSEFFFDAPSSKQLELRALSDGSPNTLRVDLGKNAESILELAPGWRDYLIQFAAPNNSPEILSRLRLIQTALPESIAIGSIQFK